MSNDVMNRIWWREDFDDLIATLREELPGSGRALKWVLISLADNANDKGYCWPAIETIAQRTMLTERSVQRAIKQALALRLLRRRLRTNNSSEYLFNLELLPHGNLREAKKNTDPFAAFDDEPDLFGGVTSVQKKRDEPSGGVTSMQGGVTSMQSRGDTVAPKPSIEPSIEPLEESVDETPTGNDIELSLSDFIKTEWDKLKARYPKMGECRKVLPSQLEIAKERAQQHRVGNQSDIEVWREVLDKVARSRFQTGRVDPTKGRNRYKLTLSELLKPHIFRETMNGKYISDDDDERDFDGPDGRRLGPTEQATRSTLQRFRQARERRG